MIVDISFPGLCGVSETTMGHSRQASATTFLHVSLFTKGDDSAKMGPVQRCFCRTCFLPFRYIATSSFDRIYQESNILWEAALAKLCFSVLCSSCFISTPKHLDSCSTFHTADVTLRALSSQFVSLF